MYSLRESVKILLRQFGYDIVRTERNLLELNGIDLVLDVGANIGQYGKLIRKDGYTGAILSFEPLEKEHKKLATNSIFDPSWNVYSRCALGERDGTTIIHRSRNSYSSSLLNMLPAHLEAAPQSIYSSDEKVDEVTLDLIYESISEDAERVFLKIDAQGYEQAILKGAKNSLSKIQGIQLELSVIPLYENQKKYDYFIRELINLGFSLWSIRPGFYDPKSGRLLQFDGIFFRDER